MEPAFDAMKGRVVRTLVLFVALILCGISSGVSAFGDECQACSAGSGCPEKHEKVNWYFSGQGAGWISFKIKELNSGVSVAAGSIQYPLNGANPKPKSGSFCARIGVTYLVTVRATAEKGTPENPNDSQGMLADLSVTYSGCDESKNLGYYAYAPYESQDTDIKRGGFTLPGGGNSANMPFAAARYSNGSVHAAWGLGRPDNILSLPPLILELTSLDATSYSFERVTIPPAARTVKVPLFVTDELGGTKTVLTHSFETKVDPGPQAASHIFSSEFTAAINDEVAIIKTEYGVLGEMAAINAATWDPLQVNVSAGDVEIARNGNDILQIWTPNGIVNVERLTTEPGYKLKFYKPGSYGLPDPANHNVRPLIGTPSPEYSCLVNDPEPSDSIPSIGITEWPGVSGREKLTKWTVANGVWTMSDVNGSGTTLRATVKSTTAENIPNSVEVLRVETTQIKSGSQVVSHRVEKFDSDNRLVKEEQGLGADAEWTEYRYTGAAPNELDWVKRSDGSFENYTRTEDAQGNLLTLTTTRPWGDQTLETADETNGHVTIFTPSSSDTIHAPYSTKVETTTEYIAGQLIGKVVRESFTAKGVDVIITKTYPTGVETVPIERYEERHAPSGNFRYGGRPKMVQNEDGTFDVYLYKIGNINPANPSDATNPSDVSFTENGDGSAMLVRTLHNVAGNLTTVPAAYDEIIGRTTEDSVMYDEDNQAIIEDKGVCVAAETYSRVSRVRHTYDSQGRRTKSDKEVGSGWRSIYSTTWSGDFLVTETDEAGIVTTYSQPDAFGNPQTIMRTAVDGGSTVVVEERHQTFNVLGSVSTEHSGPPATPVNLRSCKYNTAGRLSEETQNGVRHVYQRSNTAQGGRLETVRAGSSGPVDESTVAIKVTAYRCDGRVKSTTGDSVVSETHDYSLEAPYIKEVVTRGGSVISESKRDSLGRIVAEKIQAPNGATRTFEYYDNGRFYRELVGTTEIRSIDYSAPNADFLEETETIATSANNPPRIRFRKSYIESSGGAWWSVTETNDSKLMEKLGPWTEQQMAERTQSQSINGAAPVTTKISEERSANGGGRIEQITTTTVGGQSVLGLRTTVLRDGRPISATFNGGSTSYEYDSSGRVTLVEDSARSLSTSTLYDPVSGQPSIVTTSGGTVQTQTVYSYYAPSISVPSNWPYFVTSWNRLKSVSKDGAIPTYFDYTKRGETAHTWGSTYPTWTEYDAAGRLWKLHTYRDTGSINFYSSTWPASTGVEDITEWEYHSGTELLDRKRDPAGQGPRFRYDSMGRVNERVNAEDGNILYPAFDLAGSMLSDGSHSRLYDEKGRVTEISAGADGDSYSHTIFYDPNGAFIRDTSTSGDVITTYFDPLGRKTGVEYKNTGWNNGQLILKDSWVYDPVSGNVSSVSSNSSSSIWGSVTYSHTQSTDWLETATFNGANLKTKRTPDALWRLQTTNTTRNDGTTALPTTFGKFDYAYGPVDDPLVQQRGKRVQATLSNKSKWKYGYNNRGEVTSGSKKWWDTSEEPVSGAQFAYNFDAIGNRTTTTINGQTSTYSPNLLNQYASRTVPGVVDVSGIFSDDAVAVSPDVAGTELKVKAESDGSSKKQFHRQLTVNNAAGPVWQPVEVTVVKNNATDDNIRKEVRHADVPKSPQGFVHDAEGNLRSAGEWTYGWYPSNRLSSASRSAGGAQSAPAVSVSYNYDGMGRRVFRQVSEAGLPTKRTRYVWDGWRLIAEWDVTSGSPVKLLRTYHWGVDMSGTLEGAGGVGGLLAMLDHTAAGGPKTYHYVFDGNGNVVALVDRATGAVAAEYEYGPVGESLRSSGALAEVNPFRFSTHHWDETLSLFYAKRRYYSPVSGRWLNRDPRGEEGGVNLFAFISNDAINNIDPFGECVFIKDPVGQEGKVISTKQEKLELMIAISENDPGFATLGSGKLVHQGRPAIVNKQYPKLYVIVAGGVSQRSDNRYFVMFDILEVTCGGDGTLQYKRIRGSPEYSLTSEIRNGSLHGQVFGSFASQRNSYSDNSAELLIEAWGAYGWNSQYTLKWASSAFPQPGPVEHGYMPPLRVKWDLADPAAWSMGNGKPRPYQEDGGSDKGWGRMYRSIFGKK